MYNSSPNKWEFAIRAIVWGGFGALHGVRGSALVRLALGGPVLEQIEGVKLEEVLVELLKKNNSVNQLKPHLVNQLPVIPESTGNAQEKTDLLPKSAQYFEIDRDSRWLEAIPHPSVVLTIGRRGSGKTALNHRLLEISRFRSMPFVLGMPQQALKYLPEWLGVVNGPEEVPENSTLLVDETHLRYNARDSQKQVNREISRIINLSRQKQLTLLFVSQQARTIDRNIASSADVLIIKEPEPLQVEFERREINKLMKTAAEKFQGIKENRTKWSLVYSPARNFFDMLTNELPSYWTEKLSRIYSLSGPSTAQKPARKMSTADKIKRSKLLKSMGVEVTQIKRDIGVRSRTTVYKYLKMPG